MIELIDTEPKAEVLIDNEIILYPTTLNKHKDYLLKLAGMDRFNKTPRPELERGLEFVKHVWYGRANGEICGMMLLCHIPELDWWTLDAYKEENLDNRIGDYSFRFGRLVIDWFFKSYMVNDLYTMHRTQNRLATKVCERLDFKKLYLNPEWIILKLRRKLWV